MATKKSETEVKAEVPAEVPAETPVEVSPAPEVVEPKATAKPAKVVKTYTVFDSNGKATRTFNDQDKANDFAKILGGKVK
jgi:hypothetical protein